MKQSPELQQRIHGYLEEVKQNLKGWPPDEQRDILEGLASHIHEALASRSEQPDLELLEAVLAEMDPPDTYRHLADTTEPPPSKRRRYFFPAVISIGLLFGLIGFALHALLSSSTENVSEPETVTKTQPVIEENRPASNPPARAVPPKEPPPFVDDPALPGKWTSVDFVDVPEQFDPTTLRWEGTLHLKEMTFLPNGKTDRSWFSWSSNKVYHAGDKTISRYVIKTLGSNDYLFLEWMNGDVIYRGMKPNWYVLIRQQQPAANEESLTANGLDTFAWQATNAYVAPDFDAFFPDDPAAGKQLDELYKRQYNPGIPDDELLTIVRNGLKSTRNNKDHILRWIGNRYIWNKKPQNPQAVEILYHAAQPDNPYGTRHYAVYFGLSVLTNTPPNVLQTMANICLTSNETGRILWGLRKNKTALRPYLEPYLSDTNNPKHDIAVAMSKAIDGQLDIGQWLREREDEQAQKDFGDKMPAFREQLLTGDSRQRMETIRFLRGNYALIRLMDDSFVEAWAACAKDPDVEVRRETARLVGQRFIWSNNKSNTNAIELILNLSRDADPKVQNNCVYFGLSTPPAKSDAIIKRLIELWFTSPIDQNLHGRIEWGLRSQQSRQQLERLLEPCLSTNQPADVRTQALMMYKAVFKKDPSNIETFHDLGRWRCVFQARNTTNHVAYLQRDLPGSIPIYSASNNSLKGHSYGEFRIKGLTTYEAMIDFFKTQSDYELKMPMPDFPPLTNWQYP